MTGQGDGWQLFSPEEAAELDLPALHDPAEPTPAFATRCRQALSAVQRDLDATGYGEFQMRPVNLMADGASVQMWAALPDGSSWSGGGVGRMTPEMGEHDLLWHAAASVSDTLVEVLWIAWPICAEHGGQPMAPPNSDQAPNGLIQGEAWWWCQHGEGHPVTRVGTLTTNHATPRKN